ncbi:MAG TPA: hypothetical protein VIY27_05055 [Myxococcota bacterium]
MRVRDLKLGVLYRPTRRQRGLPNTYMLVVPKKRLLSLEKRLRARGTALTTADDRARVAAAVALAGDGVVLEVFSRYMSGEQRIETKRFLGLDYEDIDGHPREVALRAVKAPPGYVPVRQED